MEEKSECYFDLDDSQGWKQHLQDQGYVVIRQVLTEHEVSEARSKFWDWMEGLGSGILRHDISTWNNDNWPGVTQLGFFPTHGGGQNEAAWQIRSNHNVKQAFALLWDEEDLLTSMDTFIGWRPWWQNSSKESWLPRVENIHCDQNPVVKRGFHVAQAMIPLYPVTEISGGLRVVPASNTEEVQDYLAENYPHTVFGSDWCELRKNDPYVEKAVLIPLEPGDMVLWDARTLHGGLVGDGLEGYENTLVRLSLTVCMAPRSKADDYVLQKRQEAVENGYTLTHWPYEYRRHGMRDSYGKNIEYNYSPPELTDEQLSLL